VLDWDKAWAGPLESDVARMAFWDDMTGDGFWEVYKVPAAEGRADPALISCCGASSTRSARHATGPIRPHCAVGSGSQSEPCADRGDVRGSPAIGGHVSFRAWTVSR
jgi:hypothetical protein